MGWLKRTDAYLLHLYAQLFNRLRVSPVLLLRRFKSLAGLRKALKRTSRDEHEFMNRWVGNTLLSFLIAILVTVIAKQVYPNLEQSQMFITLLFLPAMFMFWYFKRPFSELTKRMSSINSDIPFLASNVRASIRAGESLNEALREAAFAGDTFLFHEMSNVVAEAVSTGDISTALMHLVERSPSRELTKLVNVFLEASSGVNVVTALDSFIERNRAVKRTKLLEYQKISDTISVTTPMFTLILFVVEVMVLFASILFVSAQSTTNIIGIVEAFIIPVIFLFSLLKLQEANPGI